MKAKPRLRYFLPLFFVAACATHPVQETHSSRLFPLGVYEQRITLTPDNPQRNPQAFRGVLSIKPDRVEVMGLSPFGSTVFYIHEDLKSGAITTRIFVEKLKPLQSRFKEYYAVLRNVLLAPRAGDWPGGVSAERRDSRGRPLQLSVPTEEGPATLRISGYDAAGIPAEMKFKAGHYQVSVLMKNYELSR
jgi:hypothetical protein